VLDGEVRASEPVLTSNTGTTWAYGTPGSVGSTWRVGIEVRARLVVGSSPPLERTVARATDFLTGVDPLETEGRRAVALRHVADEVARELLRAYER
jgi:hypothetical protein